MLFLVCVISIYVLLHVDSNTEYMLDRIKLLCNWAVDVTDIFSFEQGPMLRCI